MTFTLFFIAWKVAGVAFSEKFLLLKDQKTGEVRYHEPREVKAMIKEKRIAIDAKFHQPTVTLKEITQFPLDDE